MFVPQSGRKYQFQETLVEKTTSKTSTNWWLKCNYTARSHQIKMFKFTINHLKNETGLFTLLVKTQDVETTNKRFFRQILVSFQLICYTIFHLVVENLRHSSTFPTKRSCVCVFRQSINFPISQVAIFHTHSNCLDKIVDHGKYHNDLS